MQTKLQAILAAQEAANAFNVAVAVYEGDGQYYLVRSACDVLIGGRRISTVHPQKKRCPTCNTST